MFSLEGKNALVTGGTAGIGRAVAAYFVQAGADVLITGRRPDGNDIAEQIGARFAAVDVCDERAFAQALEGSVQERGKLDVLVLNAGIVHEHMIAELPSEEAGRVLDVNVNGVFFGLKHGPAGMNDGGSIIITSSNAAIIGSPQSSMYSASKAAASQLARCAAIELGPRRIRVNAICPGGTQTDMALPEEIFQVLTPLGRIGQTQDLVGLYNLLASDAGSYINGQEIVVDGGMTAGLTLQIFDKIFS